ncbi:coiled-coil domain-containing protein 73-like [Mya arenaria]|uniref:coiled-coil domain-containing protein 73-like n=1 Tax=Mya arenaria TaxID=6604 RepID=UPI0022E68524|nr:coiled-coil domain-containing protein 73-like [Mya arenaria]
MKRHLTNTGLKKEFYLLRAKAVIEKADKTRKNLCDELKQVKQNLVTSEKTKEDLCDQMKQVKQDLDNSEKTKMNLYDEIKTMTQDLHNSQKIRKRIENELHQAKECCMHSKKTNTGLEKEFLQAKDVKEKSEKTRTKLADELKQVKQSLTTSEKRKDNLCDQMKQVKQDSDNSEKAKVDISDEMKQVKQDSEYLEKTREKANSEWGKIKQGLDQSEKTSKVLEKNLQQSKQTCAHFEKAKTDQCDEMKHLKQDSDNSEKTIEKLGNERRQMKLELHKSEKNYSLNNAVDAVGSSYSAAGRRRQTVHASKVFKQDILQSKEASVYSKKAKGDLCDEMQQLKADSEHSENTIEKRYNEREQVKQKLDNSEKGSDVLLQDGARRSKIDRSSMHAALQRIDSLVSAYKPWLKDRKMLPTPQKLYAWNVEYNHRKSDTGLLTSHRHTSALVRPCCSIQTKLCHTQSHHGPQPTGKVEVKVKAAIDVVFTFEDGTYMKNETSTGKSYEGRTFEVCFENDSEGRLVCNMMLEAFRRGLMFTIRQDGIVGLNGIPLSKYEHRYEPVFRAGYNKFIQNLKQELESRHIDANLYHSCVVSEETFTVDSMEL